jgi:hypothetical protein
VGIFEEYKIRLWTALLCCLILEVKTAMVRAPDITIERSAILPLIGGGHFLPPKAECRD